MIRKLTLAYVWAIRIAVVVFVALVASIVSFGTEATTMVVHRARQFPGIVQERDQRCTLTEAWREAMPETPPSVRTTAKIWQQVHQMQVDAGLELLETPAGRFWVPLGDGMASAEELAEQSIDEYGGIPVGCDAETSCWIAVRARVHSRARRCG